MKRITSFCPRPRLRTPHRPRRRRSSEPPPAVALRCAPGSSDPPPVRLRSRPRASRYLARALERVLQIGVGGLDRLDVVALQRFAHCGDLRLDAGLLLGSSPVRRAASRIGRRGSAALFESRRFPWPCGPLRRGVRLPSACARLPSDRDLRSR